MGRGGCTAPYLRHRTRKTPKQEHTLLVRSLVFLKRCFGRRPTITIGGTGQIAVPHPQALKPMRAQALTPCRT